MSKKIYKIIFLSILLIVIFNVKSFAVSGTGSSQVTYSMPTKRSYVMYPDEDQINYAKLLIDKTIDGVTLTDDDMTMPEYTGQKSY